MLQKMPNKNKKIAKTDDLDKLFEELGEAIEYQQNELYYLDEATKGGTDPHEAITATLCVMGKSAIQQIIKDLDVSLKNEEMVFTEESDVESVLENIRNEADKAFPSASGIDRKQIDSIVDAGEAELAAAISAAMGILDNFMRTDKSDSVYLTGGSWDDEISKFKIEIDGMKDYNSSDIVLKSGNVYYGASLKKKETSTAADPTLLNNALGKALTPLSSGSDESAKVISSMLNDLVESKNKFWNFVVSDIHKKFHSKKITKENLIRHKEGERKYEKDLKSLDTFLNDKKMKFDGKMWTKIVNALDTRLLSPYLTSAKSIFKEIDQIIVKYSSSLAPLLLDVILKLKIYDLQKDDFNFGLVTGIGKKTKTKGFVVEKAKIIGLPALYEKMVELNKVKPEFVKREGKVQAFEEGATAAKLFYTIRYGGTEVVHLELRYKGSYTADPQFFAVFADSFQDYLLDQKEPAAGKYSPPKTKQLLTKSRPKNTDSEVEQKIVSSDEYKQFIRLEKSVEDAKEYDKSGEAIGVRYDSLESLVKGFEERGMSPVEAKQKARRIFGMVSEETNL